MSPIEIAYLVVAIIALYFAWLQVDHRFKKKKNLNKKSVDVLNKILQSRKIKIGYFNYPPFIEFDSRNPETPTGLYPLILDRVSKKFNLEVKWVQINIGESVSMIENQETDIIVSIFQTANRARKADFTAFLHSITVGGVTKKSIKDVNSLSDLLKSQYKIVVSKGEIGHELINGLKIPNSRVTVIDTDNISKIVSFVRSGDAQIALLDSVSIKNYFSKTADSYLKSLKPIFINRPLEICHMGTMIPIGQKKLSDWIEEESRVARNDKKNITIKQRSVQN